MKSRFGVVVGVAPLRVRCDRREYTGDGEANVGELVSFVPVGVKAADARRIIAEPDKRPRRYPCWLKGVVVSVSPHKALIRALPALDVFERSQSQTARGQALQVGDRVGFKVMANDGKAWNVATQEELLPPEDLREDVGEKGFEELVEEYDAFDRDE